ncbi:hypothetical protein [Bryobacter aggregatus]|uniref:hypothetical protein n=1 Tax=Bryobacter aggregatus TaxID=360054 RepID=UPI00192E5BFB|nr:hypothetical protein [Bryobacter aggregatus]
MPYLMLMDEEAPEHDFALRELSNGLQYLMKCRAPWYVVDPQTQRWMRAQVL